MALAVEWLPEEWPDGISSLKQLLVVAPLTSSILLLFRTENTAFTGRGQVVRGSLQTRARGISLLKHASRRASSTFQPYKLQAFKSCRLLYHPSARALGSRGSDERALHLSEMRGTMKRTFFLLASLFLAATVPAQTPPPPLISPEVHSDNRVTVRFRGHNDKEVAVFVEGAAKPVPMRKDDDGVWSVTTEPLAPDFYGYTIIADGVGMFDPSNHAVKPNFLGRSSVVHVPGPAS